MPVRFRITLLFSALAFVILSLVCAGIYYFSYKARIENINTRLTNRAITTARLLSQREIFDKELIRRIDRRDPPRAPTHPSSRPKPARRDDRRNAKGLPLRHRKSNEPFAGGPADFALARARKTRVFDHAGRGGGRRRGGDDRRALFHQFN